MSDDEALLALATGDSDERQHALEEIYNRYAVPLLSFLEQACRFDSDSAATGLSEAFLTLESDAEKLLDRGGDIWCWLLDRAKSRAIDAYRKHSRVLFGVPDADKDSVRAEDLQDCSVDMPPSDNAEREETKASALQAIAELEEPDRTIFLHDCVHEFDLLTSEEAAALDSTLLPKLEGIWKADTLRKRRDRLYASGKLQRFFRRNVP